MHADNRLIGESIGRDHQIVLPPDIRLRCGFGASRTFGLANDSGTNWHGSARAYLPTPAAIGGSGRESAQPA
jgi:hypothetical protein